MRSAFPPINERPAAAPGTRVVVTGATGFIGGYLVERLLACGAEVCCLIRNFDSAARLAALDVKLRQLSLADAAAVHDAISAVDLVFHCAYDAATPSHNLVATRNIVEACLAHQVKRLVYVSTFSVYDVPLQGELNEETPEGNRSSDYTRIKLELEQLILREFRDRGLRGTVLQPTIVYGPFSRPWTIEPAEMLLQGKVVLPEQGDGLCNVLFIDDLVDALILAAERSEALGERFLISGPEPVTWSRFYEEFARALGVKGPEYWSLERIARSRSIMRHIREALRNPERIVPILLRLAPVRRLFDTLHRVIPGVSAEKLLQRYFDPTKRRYDRVHVPGPSQVRFLSKKAVARCEKARRSLGYEPRINFQLGMEVTKEYLQRTYTKAKSL